MLWKNPSLTGFCKFPTNPLTNRLGPFFSLLKWGDGHQQTPWIKVEGQNQGGRLRYFNSGLFREFGSPAVHTKRSIWWSETFKQKWLILPSPLENPFLDSVWRTVKFLEYSYSSNPFQPSYPLQQLTTSPIPQGVPHLQLHLFTFFHGLNDLHLSQGHHRSPLPTCYFLAFLLGLPVFFWGGVLDFQHIPPSPFRIRRNCLIKA